MKHQRLPLAASVRAPIVVTALLTSACGGGTTPGDPVTVTVTPTVTASAPTSSTSSSPSKPAAPASDVKGRAFDYGVVTTVREVAGVTVLELDRWTWKKLDDTKLAQSGVPAQTFEGKVPYTNQNAQITFTIPVADGARILYHHCVAADQPLQTRSASMKELAGLAMRENTVVVALDDQGRLTAADNIAGCPG
jgi:hypothetical protein